MIRNAGNANTKTTEILPTPRATHRGEFDLYTIFINDVTIFHISTI